jgi:hypothetical protein
MQRVFTVSAIRNPQIAEEKKSLMDGKKSFTDAQSLSIGKSMEPHTHGRVAVQCLVSRDERTRR